GDDVARVGAAIAVDVRVPGGEGVHERGRIVHIDLAAEVEIGHVGGRSACDRPPALGGAAGHVVALIHAQLQGAGVGRELDTGVVRKAAGADGGGAGGRGAVGVVAAVEATSVVALGLGEHQAAAIREAAGADGVRGALGVGAGGVVAAVDAAEVIAADFAGDDAVAARQAAPAAGRCGRAVGVLAL